MEKGHADVFICIIMTHQPIIRVKNLSKHFKLRTNKNILTGIWRPEYKTVAAVKDISFEITKGESVAFLGPNGAGKTTSTKMMTGLLYPTTGTIEILGHAPFDRKPQFLRKIGLVMGNKAGLNWDLTARQSFWLLQNIYEIEESMHAARVMELASMLKVENKLDQQVRRLSLGERMKLELIGAILHDPEVLFLDEPTIGLDVDAKRTVRKFLRKVQKEYGTTIILTSHDMDDIEEVSDRVLVINDGVIAYDNDLKKLVKTYSRHRYVRVLFKQPPSDAELEKLGTLTQQDSGVLLRVETKKAPAAIAELTTKYEVEDIHIESTPLETIIADIFAGS